MRETATPAIMTDASVAVGRRRNRRPHGRDRNRPAWSARRIDRWLLDGEAASVPSLRTKPERS